jgi:hypothetical protein
MIDFHDMFDDAALRRSIKRRSLYAEMHYSQSPVPR